MSALHRDIENIIIQPTVDINGPINVHVDVLACVSGVTRLKFLMLFAALV